MPDNQNSQFHKKFSITYVDNQAQIDSLIPLVKRAPEIYFDMEVDNMHHYWTTISLFQVLLEKTCYLLDIQSGISLVKFLNSLEGKLLVLHGADFDLRMLFQKYNFVPFHIFDTMTASQLTGKQSFGLAALVQQYFGLKMDKKFQRADWSIRPLSEEMKRYAAKDTFFLPELKKRLEAELTAKNRLSWHEEWCDHLMQSAQVQKKPDPENLWRVKGSNRLEPRQLCVLKAGWYWREEQARNKNKPLYKILNTKNLLEIASLVPAKAYKPMKWELIPVKTAKFMKSHFISVINEALQQPPETWPAKQIINEPRYKQVPPKIMASLKEARNNIARQLKLPPSLLASREVLTAVAATRLKSRKAMQKAVHLMNWQENLLFDSWFEALNQTKRSPK